MSENLLAVLDDQYQAQMVKRGLAFYNDHLKSILEPQFNGQVVVIHLDSGDYAVGRNSSLASRQLRDQHPDGLTFAIDIGPVALDDPLSLRMRQSPIAPGIEK
jgi:hypothetical protein